MTPDDTSPLSCSIISATDRPHLVRARRWQPALEARMKKLGREFAYLAEWDRDVEELLKTTEYLERRRAERGMRR